jgi:hypothetical protein
MEWPEISGMQQHLPSDLPMERQFRELQVLYELGQALCAIHDLNQLKPGPSG